jgi:drug/metabolite transporter (DMT)-like permease
LSRNATRASVIAAFAAVYVVWGSTYLAIRYAVQTMPPLLMAGARFSVSGAMLYGWARFRGAPRPTATEWRVAALTGVLMLCLGNGSVGWAEQRIPSALAALIVAVVPLWMVLFDWMLPGGKRPTLAVVAGIVVGLVGLVVLIGPDQIGASEPVDIVGALVLIAASMAWAFGSVYNSRGARPESAAMSTGLQMLGGSVALVAGGLALGEGHQAAVTPISGASWAGWLYLVTFGSLIGFTAYIYLLKEVSPAKASTYAYVNPVVAMLLGWAIAGESITARTLVAAAIILGGVALITVAGQSSASRPSARSQVDAAVRRVGDSAD